MALEYNGTPVTDLLRCVRCAFDVYLCTDFFSYLFFLLLVCLRSASLPTTTLDPPFSTFLTVDTHSYSPFRL
jgi:hypothetical protein